MKALRTIWATLSELKNSIQRLPKPEQQNEEPQENPTPEPELLQASVDESNGPNTPAVSPTAINDFLRKHQSLVYKYVYQQLKTAIETDAESVPLFNMPHLGLAARIERKDYTLALDRMIQHYIGAEEYEKIPKCQSLLRQHHVNEILRSIP